MPPDSLLGKKIDDFVIEERLGQGAMAVVYKAFQPSINRHVALKVIRLDEETEEFRKRFAREAEVIARLEHIHILPIYAYGIDDQMAYLAMRWLKGGSLSETLRREGVSIDRAADIFKQIAQGLGYAHSKGIIHRDLKPSNIMLDDAGNAYLTDFGLAKLAEGSGEITKSGTIVGTPAYMSPEQLRGEPLDHRSDIYSLGVILYNMVVGRLPFDTTTSDLVSIIYQHLEKPPTPPRDINPNVPPEVEAVIMRGLQKNRDDRFSTATDMARALNLALGRPVGSSDSLAAMPVPRFHISQTGTGTRPAGQASGRGLYVVAGLILAALLVIAALLFQNLNANNTLQATATAQFQTEMALQAALAQTATAAIWTNTPVPTATVLENERGPASEVEPTTSDITAAHTRLGPNGFIAYITCNQNSEFHAGLARELNDLAAKDAMRFQLYDSDSDPYQQITMIERARSDGAVALIVCPLDVNLLKTSLESAQADGIPLVFFADKMENYGGVLVGGDNYLLGLKPGRLAGEIIRDEMGGKANVIILDYPDREDIVSRANGLQDGVKEVAPQANIVGRYLGATRENGKASVAQLIEDGVDFNVIVSINDNGAFGAIEAMQEAGIDPSSVIITSVDAEALAVQYIREGFYMRGSVQSSRTETAATLINSTIKLLAGGTVPEFVMVPPGPLVTKESLEAEATQAS